MIRYSAADSSAKLPRSALADGVTLSKLELKVGPRTLEPAAGLYGPTLEVFAQISLLYAPGRRP